MTNVSDFVAAGLEHVRKSWSWFLVFGILLIVLGVACVGKAQTATTFSILALGWILAVSGVFWLVSALWALSWRGFFLYLLNAIIRGVTGYLLIRHPDAGAGRPEILLIGDGYSGRLRFSTRSVGGNDANEPGFYVLMAMGSEQAGLTGVKGSIVRKAAVGRSVSNLQKGMEPTLRNAKLLQQRMKHPLPDQAVIPRRAVLCGVEQAQRVRSPGPQVSAQAFYQSC